MVDVAVSRLRAALADWIERARRGEGVVVTDRGTPVVRLVAVDSAPPAGAVSELVGEQCR